MAGVFDVQGFGVLSNFNGNLVTNAAKSAMQDAVSEIHEVIKLS